MNNKQTARDLWDEAALILEKEVPVAREAANHRLVVRRCQEVVELAIKAVIKNAGYEYPKVHDPSGLLPGISEEKALGLSVQQVQRVRDVSARLAEERAPAFYAERVYSAEEAEEALNDARFVFQTLSVFAC
jgi:HEPN domain-containing protein